MWGNMCQLWINCLLALKAPFNKCMPCDHRWNSFMHTFAMSFPVKHSGGYIPAGSGSPLISGSMSQGFGWGLEGRQWGPAPHWVSNYLKPYQSWSINLVITFLRPSLHGNSQEIQNSLSRTMCHLPKPSNPTSSRQACYRLPTDPGGYTHLLMRNH